MELTASIPSLVSGGTLLLLAGAGSTAEARKPLEHRAPPAALLPRGLCRAGDRTLLHLMVETQVPRGRETVRNGPA